MSVLAMPNNRFVESSVTINVGDTVTWSNIGGGFHDVVADDNSFRCATGCDGEGGDGNPSSANWSFSRTFTVAGTVGYHCEPHQVVGMVGTVTVLGAQSDALIPGKIAVIKQGNLARFVAKPTGGTFDPPGPGDDPSVEGGTLRVFDTVAGAGEVVFTLAQAGWKGLGNPPGSGGFKYKGSGVPNDPCKVVLIKPGVIKAVCKGAGVTLAPPFAGDAGIVLTAGIDSKRYCAVFGGDNMKNETGLFKRKDAPAPGSCPSPPP